MPCCYHIDPERRAVFIRGWGTLTEEEALDTNQALVTDPQYDADFVRLENLTAVTTFAIGSKFIRRLAERHRLLTTPRRAFVVASDEAFGIGRMVQLLADAAPDRLAVTRDLDEGFRWVGLDPTGGWPPEPASD